MSRYIDPDKIRLISELAVDGDLDILVPFPDVIKAVRMTPSEDVAPRAEVAREMCGMLREDLRGLVDGDYLERLLTIYEKKYTEEVK